MGWSREQRQREHLPSCEKADLWGCKSGLIKIRWSGWFGGDSQRR